MRAAVLKIFAILTISLPTAGWGNEVYENLLKSIEQKAHELVPELISSCVSLKAESGRWGSGVIVSEEGLIFTAAHTFTGKLSEKVIVYQNGEMRTTASLMKLDRKRDIAVLKINSPNRFNFAAIELAPVSSESPSGFFAAGHPVGFEKSRKTPVRFGLGYFSPECDEIFATCKVNVGDSGGPLFDLEGKLVAIHRTMDTQGKFSAHVPVSAFFSLWPELAAAGVEAKDRSVNIASRS